MDKISPIKGRILQYVEYKSIPKQEFCKNTGISYANMKGRSLFSEIGGCQLAEILHFYSDISPEWLLTGEGEMLKPQTSYNQSNIDIPYKDLLAAQAKTIAAQEKTIAALENKQPFQRKKTTVPKAASTTISTAKAAHTTTTR